MAYDYRYYFDGVGNRTKFIRTDLWTSDRTVVYEYSARNELTRYSDPEGSGKYWVCEYDLRGNRTKWRHTFWTDSWYSYEWDALDRLTKVYSNSNTKTTEYKYDHAGRRAAKRVNSGAGFGAWTWYSYDGLKVVAEGTSTTSKMYYTTAPGDPGGIICRDASAGTNPLYYHYDRLGNVMAVTDSNGALCAPYTMDAFGNVLQCGTSTGYSATQSDPQPYHLTTKEWDPDTALFYFNARWYERGVGMFVSAASFGKAMEEPYSFCYNNPLRVIDVDGENPFDWFWNWYYGNQWNGLTDHACTIAEHRRQTCGDAILPDSLPIDEVQRQCNELNNKIILECAMLPFGWERLPAERILSGTAKREFPSELLRYSLDDIERFLRTGKSGIATSKLQKAKKLLEQAKRLAEKCGGKSGKRY